MSTRSPTPPDRLSSTAARAEAALRDTRRTLDRIRVALGGAEAECRRLRAENVALRAARDSALTIAAWGGRRRTTASPRAEGER